MKSNFKAIVTAAIMASTLNIGITATPVTTQPPKNPPCTVFASDKMYFGTDATKNEAIFTGKQFPLHIESFTHPAVTDGGKTTPASTDTFYTGEAYQFFGNLYAETKKSSFYSQYNPGDIGHGKGLIFVYTIVDDKDKKTLIRAENLIRCDLDQYFDPSKVKSVNAQQIIKR